MKTFLIIKTGSTFPETASEHGNFEDWTLHGMQQRHQEVLTVPVYLGAPLPPPETVSAAVITGSHDMVTDGKPWMLATIDWIKLASLQNLPILGICFGHQLLAEALGGRADWNPRGREIGTLDITLTEEGQNDALLGDLPTRFPAHLTHRQSVVNLPRGARLLASSSIDPHQAFAIGTTYGVQFHPEFTEVAMRCYIDILAPELHEEGFDVDKLRNSIKPTPEAHSLLQNFCKLALRKPR